MLRAAFKRNLESAAGKKILEETVMKLPLEVLGEDGGFMLYWDDEASDDQESISFEISLSAVDLAGNMSEPSHPMSVYDPGGVEQEEDCPTHTSKGGCAAASRKGRPVAGLSLLLVGLLGRRKSTR